MKKVLFIGIAVSMFFCTSCTKEIDDDTTSVTTEEVHQPESFLVSPKDSFTSELIARYVVGSPIMANMPKPQKFPGNQGRKRVYLIVCPKLYATNGQAPDRNPAQVREYVESIGYIPAGAGYLAGLDSEYHSTLKLIPRNFVSVATNGLKTIQNGAPQDVGVLYLSIQTGIGNPILNAGYTWYPIETFWQCLSFKK